MSLDTTSSKIEKKARTGWMLSYGDVITLLITFFIMMISKQMGDISRVNQWVNDRLSDAKNEIEMVIVDRQLDNLSVALHSKGVQITLSGQSIFNTGEAEPLPNLENQLIDLSKAIKNLQIFKLEITEHRDVIAKIAENGHLWNVEIRIEGHTDNVPLIKGRSRYEDNWELSAARAQNVMKLLQEHTQLDEQKFAVAGFGKYQPVADNKTADGRALNRRVEIYIDASIMKRQ